MWWGSRTHWQSTRGGQGGWEGSAGSHSLWQWTGAGACTSGGAGEGEQGGRSGEGTGEVDTDGATRAQVTRTWWGSRGRQCRRGQMRWWCKQACWAVRSDGRCGARGRQAHKEATAQAQARGAQKGWPWDGRGRSWQTQRGAGTRSASCCGHTPARRRRDSPLQETGNPASCEFSRSFHYVGDPEFRQGRPPTSS